MKSHLNQQTNSKIIILSVCKLNNLLSFIQLNLTALEYGSQVILIYFDNLSTDILCLLRD